MKKDSDSGVAAKNGQKRPERATVINVPSSKNIKTPFSIIIEQTDEPDKMKLFF